MKKIMTLCFVHQHPKILLGMKKQGLGEGKWNGFGGKVEEGEDIFDAVKREMKEESGLDVDNLEKVGITWFRFRNEEKIFEVHIFKTSDFKGELIESNEMKPRWFHVDEIPYREMWPDDFHWIPLMIEGKKFRGDFLFQGYEKLLEHFLEEVEEI